MSHILTYILVILSFISFTQAETKNPNIVIVFLDDAGYSDFSPFAKTPYPTPNVQKLADGGTKFTQFYVPQAVCSASRSALLTGCYPERTKVFGAHGPGARGLETNFTTIAEMVKANGYTTAHFGKWHCGDQEQTRPLARGFDFHAGLMYSNDMWRYNEAGKGNWDKFPLQFWENGKVKIEDMKPENQKFLTKWATENSVNFIKQNKNKPFFLYLAHSMPHVPLFCSPEFEGKSGVGLFGDVMMEIDWSVGEITKTLEEEGLTKNTLIIFSSDNGPWRLYGNHAGLTPFRQYKGTSFDGGIHSPLIIKYPEKVPANTSSDTPFCTIDFLPTIAHITNSKLPENEIDGLNVWEIVNGSSKVNPHPFYAFSTHSNTESIMSGDGEWKLHLPHKYTNVIQEGNDGKRGTSNSLQIELSLYNLKKDPYEKQNLINEFPDIAEKLKIFANQHLEKFSSIKSKTKKKSQ